MREESSRRKLRLQLSHLAEMRQAVVAAAPEEGCGLVLGIGEKALEVVPIENVLHSPTRFRLEAAAQVKAIMEAALKGWELVAIFHSHPTGPTHPSPSDLAEAAYPEALYLIWDPGPARRWECRAFELIGISLTAGASSFLPVEVVSEE
jgi:proteasome lid subunit RPN8/RPN11